MWTVRGRRSICTFQNPSHALTCWQSSRSYGGPRNSPLSRSRRHSGQRVRSVRPPSTCKGSSHVIGGHVVGGHVHGLTPLVGPAVLIEHPSPDADGTRPSLGSSWRSVECLDEHGPGRHLCRRWPKACCREPDSLSA